MGAWLSSPDVCMQLRPKKQPSSQPQPLSPRSTSRNKTIPSPFPPGFDLVRPGQPPGEAGLICTLTQGSLPGPAAPFLPDCKGHYSPRSLSALSDSRHSPPVIAVPCGFPTCSVLPTCSAPSNSSHQPSSPDPRAHCLSPHTAEAAPDRTRHLSPASLPSLLLSAAVIESTDGAETLSPTDPPLSLSPPKPCGYASREF